MNLTLETADIVSAKVEDIVVKYGSIEEEIKNGTKSYKLINIEQLPKEFEGFMWNMKNKTMIAIRGNNQDFQVVILDALLPKYLSNFKAIRKFTVRGHAITAKTTEDYTRLCKSTNNANSKITLNAEIIA